MGAAVRFETQEHWQAKRLSFVPAAWAGRVARLHEKKCTADLAAGNLWLLDLSEGMRKIRVPVNLSDAELIAFATDRAAQAMGLAEVAPGVYLSEPVALRRRLVAYVETYGIKPPEPLRMTRKGKMAGVSDAGAIARMCCPLWWRRKLRQHQARALEGKAIELGYVHRRGEIYASNATVERRAQQRARNAAGLEATEAINRDTGEIFNLAQLAAASVANPRIRRGELMTRIAGFEAIAKGMEHAAEFVTLTAPSKYHAKRTDEGGRVEDNPRYSGATPREAQGYLARLWANIRAKLHRMGIAPYGFRIAEPHHDATPHWHMLLFVAPWLSPGRSAVSRLRAVIRRYALREDGREPGARAARVTFKAIDWARGSAAGYVAKYVSKNIDGGGYQVQGDIEGGPGDVFPGHRVEAWASTWGIRQFQQVGGPPVGVWRELRRLERGAEYPPVIEAARSAADCGRSGHDETGAAGNWRRYVEVMGLRKGLVRVETWQRWGKPSVRKVKRQFNKVRRVVNEVVTVKRLNDGRREVKAWPICIARTRPGEVWNYAEGAPEPANLTRYGEVSAGAPYGVALNEGRAFATVRYRWEIRGQQATARSGGKCVAGEDSGPVGSEAGALYRPIAATGAGNGAGFGLAFDSPWSPVNNCSREVPALLPWAELIAKTPVADRAIWLEGAAFSAWIEANGGDRGGSQGNAAGSVGIFGGAAGRGGESVAMGHAPELRHGARAGAAGGGDGAGAGQGAGVGTVGAGGGAGA